jgi:hypothetical protein
MILKNDHEAPANLDMTPQTGHGMPLPVSLDR